MGNNEASTFDPYHKWLAIPPAEQPPSHYRLLGLQAFEDDAEVIASAADRQMAHVKSFAAGPYSSQSQKLLDELARARITLLNAAAKKVYDTGLQRAESVHSDDSGASRVAARPSHVAQHPVLSSAIRFHPLTEAPTASAKGAVDVNPQPIDTQPAMSIVPIHVDGTSSRLATRHRASTFRRCIEFFSVLLLLFFSTTTAYVLLVTVDPRFDVLSLFNQLEVTANGPRQSSTQDAAAQDSRGERQKNKVTRLQREPPEPPADNSRPPTNSRATLPAEFPGEPQPGRLPLPGGIAPPEQPATRKIATADGTHERPLPASPFDHLPREIDLPRAEDVSLEIGEIESVAEDQLLLRVVPLDNTIRGVRTFVTRIATSGEADNCWELYYVTKNERLALETGTKEFHAVAEFRFSNRTLTFHWLTGATTKHWEQLRNDLVELKCAEEEYVIQLRQAQTGKPVVIQAWKEPFEVKLRYDSLPRANNMFLDVTPDGFPPLRHVAGEPAELPRAEKGIWQDEAAQYVGLAVWWTKKGNQVTLTVAPGFRLESKGQTLFGLSSSELKRQKELGGLYLKQLEEELRKRQAGVGGLDQQLKAAKNLLTTYGGMILQSLVVKRDRAVVAAEAAKTNNQLAMNNLANVLIPVVKRDLGRFPTLENFAKKIEGHATVGLRLYSWAEGRKIILYTTGAPDGGR